jgi:FkbM family methyltransferase
VKPWQIKVRSLARKTGVIRVINKLRPERDYEARVNAALAGAVKMGDTVWDVGANVGVYTELFSRWVGEDGCVVAFEPFSGSCDKIKQRLPNCRWVQIENVALGDTDMAGFLVTGSESVENHLATGAEAQTASADSVPVVVCRGDTVLSRLGKVPNVMKVDVEGFEEEVLAGMSQLLTDAALRSVLVEVHFKKLEMRGLLNAPIRIEKLFAETGFHTSWVDSSHLFATRPARVS